MRNTAGGFLSVSLMQKSSWDADVRRVSAGLDILLKKGRTLGGELKELAGG